MVFLLTMVGGNEAFVLIVDDLVTVDVGTVVFLLIMVEGSEAFILIEDDLVTVDVGTVVFLLIMAVVILPFLMVVHPGIILYLWIRTFSLVYLVFHRASFYLEVQSNALFLPDVLNHVYLSPHGDLDRCSSDESAHNRICYDVALRGA